MGYPEDSMILPDDAPSDLVDPTVFAQFDVLGNAFAVPTMAHIVTCLGPVFRGETPVPPARSVRHLPSTFEEVAEKANPNLGN